MFPTVICAFCQNSFPIDDRDQAYYQKIAVPFPTLCPLCRLQRRLAFRNERNLYRRKCDRSGRDLISNFRPDAQVPVYHVEEWHKDGWDGPLLPFYDFSKGFFEQFAMLSQLAPRTHKVTAGNEINSEYMNHSGNCKNCYYIFNCEYVEDSLYLKFCDHCRDCIDCTTTLNSELCYECVNVDHGYRLVFSDDCKTSSDSAFLRFCRGVKNSLFCYGLEHKEYHIFNQPHTKEQYARKLKELQLHTYTGLQKAIQTWNEWSAQFPAHREIILNCENSTGDALYNCKNASDCYNCIGLEDCRYLVHSVRAKDSYDFFAYGEVELGYEYITGIKSYNVKFTVYGMDSDNLEYCDTCFNCHYCFGCVGLKGKSYCIFNKQYSKKDYFDIVKRIKEKMTMDKEYGEFFPMQLSPFPYEDTLAEDYFPRGTKMTLPPQGTFWEVDTLPDQVHAVNPDLITQNAYRCPVTNKLFRFQKQELQFYEKMQVALPRMSFEARYQRRNKMVPFPTFLA